MTLVGAFERLWMDIRPAFSQHRVAERARRLAYGFVTAWGRHTVSRALCALNAQFQDWSASYRVFSRSPWRPHDLFQPLLERSFAMAIPSGPIPLAMDDTTLKKTSQRIPGVSYARDPMSPPFHPNLVMGQRFIQLATIVRPEGLNGPARTLPIRFEPAPPPAKPGRKASEEAWAAYRQAKKTQTLSWQAVRLVQDVRERADQAGYAGRSLLLVADGSYCNSTVFRHLPDRVDMIARARGDLNLFQPLPEGEGNGRGRRRKYGAPLPKPKEIRGDDTYPWQEAQVFGAGRLHLLRYKTVSGVLWRSGTRTQPLRLLIIAPLRYRPTARSRLLYRDPAYLLTTDLTTPAETLLQAYFDRWEIEVNHRDEKSLFGVGQAQVWSENAAMRLPQFQVAVYSMLLLASLMAHGPKRTSDYLPLPKWRKQEERRPSVLDILALMREELLAQAIDAGGSSRPAHLQSISVAG